MSGPEGGSGHHNLDEGRLPASALTTRPRSPNPGPAARCAGAPGRRARRGNTTRLHAGAGRPAVRRPAPHSAPEFGVWLAESGGVQGARGAGRAREDVHGRSVRVRLAGRQSTSVAAEARGRAVKKAGACRGALVVGSCSAGMRQLATPASRPPTTTVMSPYVPGACQTLAHQCRVRRWQLDLDVPALLGPPPLCTPAPTCSPTGRPPASTRCSRRGGSSRRVTGAAADLQMDAPSAEVDRLAGGPCYRVRWSPGVGCVRVRVRLLRPPASTGPSCWAACPCPWRLRLP